MTTVLANATASPSSVRKKRGLLSAAVLIVMSVTLAPIVLESNVAVVLQSAKAEIENCTVKGVGAAISNGNYTLTLPTGCRLAG